MHDDGMSDAMSSHATAINQEAHPMDTLNDHAARISARIEEYRTLDLIGRNSADDLQHHLRALAAERDEANARAERWKRLAEGWEDDFREQMMEAPSGFVETTILEMRREHLLPTDLDAAPGDTAGER